MKTHFYFEKDTHGDETIIWSYAEDPKKDRLNNDPHYVSPQTLFYKRLKPILSKIAPGKCIRVSCDFKVVT